MPTINKGKGLKSWAEKPKPKEPQQGWNDGSEFYNSTAWRNLRQAYIDKNPLCEVSRFEKKFHAGKEVDHIIPIRYGGAIMDERNLMSMTEFYHRRKTGLESHRKSPLIEWIETPNGLIPKRREDIFSILIKKQW